MKYFLGFLFFITSTVFASQEFITVTNLDDHGTGSLRDALSVGNRNIVFAVDGVIHLQTPIVITNFNDITINGRDVNDKKLKNLIISGEGLYFSNAHNIILQNLRIRNVAKYGILLTDQTSDVVIDHCSIENASRDDIEFGKDIDINNSAHNITVSHSIVGYYSDDGTDVLNQKYKGMLITDNNLKPAVTNVFIEDN